MDSLHLTDGMDQSFELDRLRDFRGLLYGCLGRRTDELFELTDALLCAEGPVRSLFGLCLAPAWIFHRGDGCAL